MFGGPRRMMRQQGGGGRGQKFVQEVQALMAQGRFVEAGKMCVQLSGEAAQRGLIGPAVRMSLIGARAYVQAKQPDEALNLARRALGLMMTAGNPQRATRAIPTAIAFMRANGYAAQAATLEKEASAKLAQMGLKLGQPFGQGQGEAASLPSTCPNCGGAIRSDNTEWIDATSVECPWCGSTVKAS